MQENSFYNLLEKRIKENKSKLIFQKRDGWSWKQITWLDLQSEVKGIACFLIDIGFSKNDKVIFYSGNTIEALFFKLAVFLLGGTIIPVSKISRIKEISADQGQDCFLFSDNTDVLDKLSDEPSIKKGFVVTDRKIDVESKFVNYENVVKFGFLKTKKLKDTLDEQSSSVSCDTDATLFYKPDENSSSRPVRFSQQKILNLLKVIQKKLRFVNEETQTFSFLPENSSFSEFANILNIQIGSRGAIASNRENFFEDILEVMPSVLFITRNQLEEIVKDFRDKDEDLGKSLGSRLQYIFTDSMPGDDVRTDLVKDGITVIELNQLAIVDTM